MNLGQVQRGIQLEMPPVLSTGPNHAKLSVELTNYAPRYEDAWGVEV
jgi:hypothetical protein